MSSEFIVMDGSAGEHSDSDSGESWTLLENNPAYAEDAPEFPDVNPTQRDASATNIEKDEDTDGISIISDSDRETSSPCELTYDKCLEEIHPIEQNSPQYISVTPLPTNNINLHQSIRSEDDFLGHNSGKHKTYVHRRNKRLSTVLNIIMLGSVITAAGVAIGHMWGARNECSVPTTPSVNKILSNLYRLQEENAYLRSKLKELSIVGNMQMQRKSASEKLPNKRHKCKKVFEESLNNRNSDKITKCVDYDQNNSEPLLGNHATIQPEYEKEFLNDIDKLKNVYQQNKSWLDEEVAKRMKHEEKSLKNIRKNLRATGLKTVHEEPTEAKYENAKEQEANQAGNAESVENIMQDFEIVPNTDATDVNLLELKISYADSLKSEQPVKKNWKRGTNQYFNDASNEQTAKKKVKREDKIDIKPERSFSDYDFKKDDRYIGPKVKEERKKNDRQKLHKKQKRKNKYEQWQMKGGYMKDFDEFSINSQENEHILKNPDINFRIRKNPEKDTNSQDFEQNTYTNQFPESDTKIKSKKKSLDNEHKVDTDNIFAEADKNDVKKIKNKELNWYMKRAAVRTDARKNLEQELFGENNLNHAGWYFRRMQKREQCRAKGDNSTHRKMTKNYKIKH